MREHGAAGFLTRVLHEAPHSAATLKTTIAGFSSAHSFRKFALVHRSVAGIKRAEE